MLGELHEEPATSQFDTWFDHFVGSADDRSYNWLMEGL